MPCVANLWQFVRLLCHDRFAADVYRRFGYFIEGLEPQWWWWDIVVKRADIACMMLVTYTSFTDDDKVKLLVYPFLSAVQLFLSLWCKPFLNSQAEILDMLELCLLSSRCFFFYAISIILLFNPDAVLCWIIAGFVIAIFGAMALYLLAHIAAQMLRKAREDQAESSGNLQAPDRLVSLRGAIYLAQKLQRFVVSHTVSRLLPLFQDDTPCTLKWRSKDKKLLFEFEDPGRLLLTHLAQPSLRPLGLSLPLILECLVRWISFLLPAVSCRSFFPTHLHPTECSFFVHLEISRGRE